MPYELADRLVVGIAPSALFDASEAHQAFLEGIEYYRSYQQEHVNDPLPRGAAFPFVKRLLALNDLRPGNNLVEVIVMAKDDAVTGLRIMKSIEHYKLPIDRAVFTEGRAPYEYIEALNICLYLSGSRRDAETAASLGYPAGRVLGHRPSMTTTKTAPCASLWTSTGSWLTTKPNGSISRPTLRRSSSTSALMRPSHSAPVQ